MLRKVSIVICFLAMFSFVVFSPAVAKNSEKGHGPGWKDNSPPGDETPETPEEPTKPEKPEKPKGSTGPKLDPPEGTPPENKGPKGPSGPSGKSSIGHLYLYEKTPIEGTDPWPIVEGGAWGKLKYNSRGPAFKYVFNGHGLTPDTEYTLIYYPDPWPGTGLVCLGAGAANEGGDIHMGGSVKLDISFPSIADLNNPDNDGHAECIENSTCIEGAKIWVVLSADVDCDGGGEGEEATEPKMIGWNPVEYLFEDIGIFYFNPNATEKPPEPTPEPTPK
jgi:hypothetical protein